jgi:tripartite-type tricarboxylate transporter receptor subunit TctC
MTATITRRAMIGALAIAPSLARAQGWPARPPRLVLPFPPGGTADVLGRTLAERLGAAIGQAVVVENRSGASGNIAAELVARAAPDGYTFFLGTQGTHAANAALFQRLPYDPVKDFVAIAPLAIVPNILVVHPSVPARTVAEFIAYAKANPGRLRFGSSGNGTSIHLAGEMFKAATGVEIEHVPYRGSAPAQTDLLAGRIELMFELLPGTIGQIRAGGVRPIAVASRARMAALPDVPTFTEAGVPGFVTGAWFGVFAPAGTPDPIVRRVAAAMAEMTGPNGSLLQRLGELGAEPLTATPEEFSAFIVSETARWADVVKRSGARLD